MFWIVKLINNVPTLISTISPVQIEFLLRFEALRHCRALNIRDFTVYTDTEEFVWSLMVSGDKYRHAPMRDIIQSKGRPDTLTLCDRQSTGVSYYPGNPRCPHCMNTILEMNDGFVPPLNISEIDSRDLNNPFNLFTIAKKNNLDYQNYCKFYATG